MKTVMNKITFEKATIAYKKIIFSWLAEPHVQEFWDNTQGHKDDILNFMGGRKEPSNYCDGKYIYWIALYSGKPYAMLMTICETIKDNIGEYFKYAIQINQFVFGNIPQIK